MKKTIEGKQARHARQANKHVLFTLYLLLLLLGLKFYILFIFCSYFYKMNMVDWLLTLSYFPKKKIFSYFRHIIVVFFRFSAVVVVVGSPMSQFDTCQRVVAHVLFRFDSIFFVPKFIKHLFRKEGSFRIEHLFDFVLVFTLKWRKKISLRFYFKLIPID